MTDGPFDGPADGETYDDDRDRRRLSRQRQRTYEALSDHRWHTSVELTELVGDNWASVGARLRDLRKEQYGGYTIERRCVRRGLWEFRMAEEDSSSRLQVKLQEQIKRYRETHSSV